MPKLVSRLPKYRRHKASGQAVVFINGKDFYLGSWNSAASKAEYGRLIGEYLAHGRVIEDSPDALAMSDVTQILKQIEAGDSHAAGQLMPLVYEELRKLAEAQLAAERPDHTLQAISSPQRPTRCGRSWSTGLWQGERRSVAVPQSAIS